MVNGMPKITQVFKDGKRVKFKEVKKGQVYTFRYKSGKKLTIRTPNTFINRKEKIRYAYDLTTGQQVDFDELQPNKKYEFLYRSGKTLKIKTPKRFKEKFNLLDEIVPNVPRNFWVDIIDGYVLPSLEDNHNIISIENFLDTTEQRISLILRVTLYYDVIGGMFEGSYDESRKILISRFAVDSLSLVITKIVLLAADNQQLSISGGSLDYDEEGKATNFKINIQLLKILKFNKKGKLLK